MGKKLRNATARGKPGVVNGPLSFIEAKGSQIFVSAKELLRNVFELNFLKLLYLTKNTSLL